MTDMASDLRAILQPLAADLGVEIFDLEFTGGVLRVALDRADGGVDIDVIAAATRLFSRALDAEDPIPGRYTLEVSSPGLERPLRAPAHFRWAVGRVVTLKTVPTADGPRRIQGTLERADDHGCTVVADHVDGQPVDLATGGAPRFDLAYDDIAQARTVFEWGPTPRPGQGPSSRPRQSQKRVST